MDRRRSGRAAGVEPLAAAGPGPPLPGRRPALGGARRLPGSRGGLRPVPGGIPVPGRAVGSAGLDRSRHRPRSVDGRRCGRRRGCVVGAGPPQRHPPRPAVGHGGRRTARRRYRPARRGRGRCAGRSARAGPGAVRGGGDVGGGRAGSGGGGQVRCGARGVVLRGRGRSGVGRPVCGGGGRGGALRRPAAGRVEPPGRCRPGGYRRPPARRLRRRASTDGSGRSRRSTPGWCWPAVERHRATCSIRPPRPSTGSTRRFARGWRDPG